MTMTNDQPEQSLPADSKPPTPHQAQKEGDEVMQQDSKTDLIEKHKTEGNLHYAAKKYDEAISSYRAGLEACSSSSSDSQQYASLQVALRSNLAVTLLKLFNYQQALEECNLALALDTTNPKCLYRRGLAREGLAYACKNDKQEQERLLQEALDDIQTCLTHISSVSDSTETKIATMKRAALAAQTRMQDRLLQQQQQGNGNTNTHATTETVQSNGNVPTIPTDANGGNHGATTTIAPFKSQSQQRLDVIQLLTANNNTFRSMQDEAYFLLDWNWWCRWCRHVDFFPTENGENSSEQEAILQLLPPGAILPDYCIKQKRDDDSTSSSTCSDSSKSTTESHQNGPPNEIDNTALFQVNHYSNNNSKSTPLFTRLKPNLVRGHHYELVPREVYNALKIWHGEVTPSICRRVQVHQEVAKLPIYTDFFTKKEQLDAATETTLQQCGACQAPSATCRCSRCFQTFYCGRSCQESHFPFHKQVCKQMALQQEETHNYYFQRFQQSWTSRFV